MSNPYWSYGEPGKRLVLDAVNEGRRYAALELATRTEGTDSECVTRARLFEEYLKGGPAGDRAQLTPERLADLEKSERKLIALETAGVDNWSGYDEAVADLDDEG